MGGWAGGWQFASSPPVARSLGSCGASWSWQFRPWTACRVFLWVSWLPQVVHGSRFGVWVARVLARLRHLCSLPRFLTMQVRPRGGTVALRTEKRKGGKKKKKKKKKRGKKGKKKKKKKKKK